LSADSSRGRERAQCSQGRVPEGLNLEVYAGRYRDYRFEKYSVQVLRVVGVSKDVEFNLRGLFRAVRQSSRLVARKWTSPLKGISMRRRALVYRA